MLSELIKSRTGLISAGYLEIRTFIMSVTYKYMDNDDVDYNSKYIQYIYFESFNLICITKINLIIINYML